jgi:hypothetical protein
MQTQISTIQNRMDNFNMVLRPETLSLRTQFRNQVSERIDTSNDRLPSYSAAILDGERVNFIDRNTILQLNDTQNPEQRTEIMNNIINFTNSDTNRMLLIENSSDEVKKYLKDLFIRSSTSENITHEQLYTIGNIIIYTMSNIPEVNAIREIIDPLRNSMFDYDRNQIMNFILQISPDVNQQIDEANLSTENQVQQNNERINNRIILNRQRICWIGATVAAGYALGIFGFPYLAPFVGPVGNIVARSLPSSSTSATDLISSTNTFGSSTLREIFENVFKKMHLYI